MIPKLFIKKKNYKINEINENYSALGCNQILEFYTSGESWGATRANDPGISWKTLHLDQNLKHNFVISLINSLPHYYKQSFILHICWIQVIRQS